MKLKDIGFYFENCEYISIDGKSVGYFLVDDIKTSIERIACNSIDEMKIAKTFAIEISKNGNGKYAPFSSSNPNETKFERLMKYGDITQIDFTLFDDSCYDDYDEYDINDICDPVDPPKVKKVSYHLFVDWIGKDDYTNYGQHSYLSKNENLYIVISGEKKLGDIFKKEYIDDPEYDVCSWN